MKGLASYGLQSKSCLLSVYINKALLKHNHTHLYIVYEGFHASMAELSGCERWYGLQTYDLALHRKIFGYKDPYPLGKF